MPNKSLKVHYMNKYPGGMVQMRSDGMSVYDASGNHVVELEKDALGAIKCVSKEHGCSDEHCLGALPKWARRHKVMPDGSIGKDPKFEERSKHVKAFGQDMIPGAKDARDKKGEMLCWSKGGFSHEDAAKMNEPAPLKADSSEE